jgi:hypothetical protein
LEGQLGEEAKREAERQMAAFRAKALALNKAEREGWRAFGEKFAELLPIWQERIKPNIEAAKALKQEGRALGLVQLANEAEGIATVVRLTLSSSRRGRAARFGHRRRRE